MNSGKEDEKAVLLGERLKAVSLSSITFDSLLQEVRMLPPYQQVQIILDISHRDEVIDSEIEKQEELLIDALFFPKNEKTEYLLWSLINIYQKLDQLGYPEAAKKGIERCEELENLHLLSQDEIREIQKIKVAFFNKQGLYKESILILYDLLKEHREAKENIYVIQDLYTIATYFIRLGDLEKGLSTYKEAYQQALDAQLLELQFLCLASIIDTSCILERYSDVKDICHTIDVDSMALYMPAIYSKLSKCYLKLQRSDSARFYLAKMHRKTQQGDGVVFFCQMAETYIEESREDSAAFCLNEAVRIFNKQSDLSRGAFLPRYFMPVYSSYASLLQKNGKTQQAGEAFRLVEPLMKEPVTEPARLEKQIDALGRYSAFCQATKQYKKAADLLVYRDSIQKIYYEEKISSDSKNWTGRFEIQELENENKLKQQQLDNTMRMTASSWTFSLILVLVVSVSVFINCRLKRNIKEYHKRLSELTPSPPAVPQKREPLSQQEQLYNAARKLVTTKKLYLNSSLTLDELAERLDTNRTALSAAINKYSGGNFNQWINKFRIDHALKRIMFTDNLRDLAEEVGFKSCSTFYSSFKECEGCAPGEYKKKHKYDTSQDA